MIFATKNISVELSDKNGSIQSCKVMGREICTKTDAPCPLFTVKLLDDAGNAVYLNALNAQSISIEKNENGADMKFYNLADYKISVCASVKVVDERIHWTVSVDNRTSIIAEWIEFPQIVVIDSFKAEGGEFEIFWPLAEGIVIDNKKIRNGKFMGYKEIGGQSEGYYGYFPGPCNMQFMAYYNGKEGLYFASHDADMNPKTVEFREENGGIALEYRLFLNGLEGERQSGYDVVMAGFSGDWQDAAEIYRTWADKHANRPKKLFERDDLPKWLGEAPIVMVYPIRGTKDYGDMTPNMYYPYANALPIVKEFSEKMNSKIMALPMHWEGTAPWAPPYVWPPYGGEDEFKSFVDALHAQGNLAGLYCSGIGWTTESYLEPSYNPLDKYDESLMCRTPMGTIEQSKVLGAPIRQGYDMCPESEKVAEIVSGEVVSIAKSGCDYAQYFDQNLGGMSYFCYGRDHGHPKGPGKWQVDAMNRIYDKIQKELNSAGSKMIIGCECAASEPFIGKLPLNDLRFNIAYFYGRPVPAYSYIFHEYINNFMGNQNTIHRTQKLSENPHSLLHRIAYSLAAGDMLTVALGDNAEIHYGWDVPWEWETPNQDNIFNLIKNINPWRIRMEKYLRYGKMLKTKELENTGVYNIYLDCGEVISCSSLITVRWQAPDGEQAQIIVNFLPEEQTCVYPGGGRVVTADGEYTTEGEIKIAPLSAVWVL